MRLSNLNLKRSALQGFYMFLGDFEYRYKLAFFGYWWALVKPLTAGLPLMLIGYQFNFTSEDIGMPYAAYALTGMLFWNLFWDGVWFPIFYMRRLRNTISQVPMDPNSVLFCAGSHALLNFSLSFLVTMIVSKWVGATIHLTGFLMFTCVPLFILAGFTLGMPFALLSNVYHDIRFAAGYIGSFLLWAAPIVHEIPAKGPLSIINRINPLSYFIINGRNWMFTGRSKELEFFAISAIVVIVGFTFSLLFFRIKLRRTLEHVI